MKKIIFVLFFFAMSVSAFSNESAPNPDGKIASIKNIFCGQENELKTKSKIRTLLNERVSGLPPNIVKKLPAMESMVEDIKSEIWLMFQVDQICYGAKEGDERLRFSRDIIDRSRGISHGYDSSTFDIIPEEKLIKSETILLFINKTIEEGGDLGRMFSALEPIHEFFRKGVVESTLDFVFGKIINPTTHINPFVLNSLIGFVSTITVTYGSIVGIYTGLRLAKERPLLGYSMVASSVTAYFLTLVDLALQASFISTGITGSFSGELILANMASILGVSAGVLTGVMIGGTVAVAITAILVKMYVEHRKRMKVSGKDLIVNGVFDVLKTPNGESVLSQLWKSYKGKDRLNKVILNMATVMENLLKEKVKVSLHNFAKDLKDPKLKPKIFKLKKRDRITHFFNNIKKKLLFKKYFNELDRFYSFVGNNKYEINYEIQSPDGKELMLHILQSRYMGTNFKLEGHRYISLFREIDPNKGRKERLSKAQDFITKNKGHIKVNSLSYSNIKRILLNDNLAYVSGVKRWQIAIPQFEYKRLWKEGKSKFFQLKAPLYVAFIWNLDFYFKKYFVKLRRYFDANKDRSRINRKILTLMRKAFGLRKNLVNVDYAFNVLKEYSDHIKSTNEVSLRNYGTLRVVDQKSCQAEIKFVCGMSSLLFQSLDLSYHCPLNSCSELNNSNLRLMDEELIQTEKMFRPFVF